MSLPKGFKRLEFIQSSGTQYVDTGFIPSVSPRIDIDMTVLDNSDVDVLGTATATSPCWILNFDTDNGGSIFYRYYSSSYKSYIFASNSLVGRRAKYSVGQTVEIDGTTCITMSAYDFSSFTQTVRLFGGRTFAPVRLYSCRIYNGNILVQDFIPCQNASGEVGLWDALNEVFYGNVGTGTFTAGPVVPEQVDESEITELEYIQSSGTQYVDSGLIPNQDTRIEMDVVPLSIAEAGGSTGFIPYGAATSYNSNAFECYTTASKLSFNYDGQYSVNGTISVGTKIHISHNKNVVLVRADGATVVEKAFTYQTFTAPYSLTVCASHRADMLCGHQKVKACQAYENGLLERDFVPAMLSNGEVGLYDRVFHEFYRNAGTGEFIAGPEMVHDDYTELEHIESDGNQYVNAGFYATQNTSVDGDAEFLSDENYPMLCGSYNSGSNQFAVFFNASKWNAWFGTASVNFAGEYEGRKTFSLDKTAFAVDDDTAAISSNDFTATLPMFIFALHQSNTAYYQASLRLFKLNFLESGLLIRAYIPKLHPSGVAGIWDSVNERFYASATTVDFIAGPEAQTVPKAPANFRVESETDTLVTLAWDPMEDVLGYRLYRAGQLLADTTETSVSVTVEPFAGAVFTLTAYNENGEGAGAMLTYYSIPENPLLYLITDRTQADVTERNPKGYYAASDLNRVGYAVEYLAVRLRESGITVTVSPVLTWTDADWGTPGTMQKYLADVQTMRGALKLVESTPDVPSDMEKLTYTEANQIELILLALDTHIRNMLVTVDAGWASGLAYTGFYAKEAY